MASLSINSQIEYAAPSSLMEASNYLKNAPNAQILAGGHSLLTAIKLGQIKPSHLIDLIRIPDLDKIEWSSDTSSVSLGAMVTYAQVASSSKVNEFFPALTDAVSHIGDVQIRNWGRIGDTFAYGDLACDLLAAALALDAVFTIETPSENRQMPAAEFVLSESSSDFVGDLAGKSSGAVLTTITFPPPMSKASAYEAFQHPTSGYTQCGSAAVVKVSETGKIVQCQIVIAGASIFPTRLQSIEASLIGMLPTSKNLGTIAGQVKKVVRTTNRKGTVNLEASGSDSADYIAHLAGVLTDRAFRRALTKT